MSNIKALEDHLQKWLKAKQAYVENDDISKIIKLVKQGGGDTDYFMTKSSRLILQQVDMELVEIIESIAREYNSK